MSIQILSASAREEMTPLSDLGFKEALVETPDATNT